MMDFFLLATATVPLDKSQPEFNVNYCGLAKNSSLGKEDYVEGRGILSKKKYVILISNFQIRVEINHEALSVNCLL